MTILAVISISKRSLLLAACLLAAQPVGRAEEQHPVLTMPSATTLSGYVNTSAGWRPGTGSFQPVTEYSAAETSPAPGDEIGVGLQMMGDFGLAPLQSPALGFLPDGYWVTTGSGPVFGLPGAAGAVTIPEPDTFGLALVGLSALVIFGRARTTGRV